MRIALIIHSLSSPGGGSERVISLLSQYWVQKGWEVHLCIYDSSPAFFRFDPRIHFHSVDRNTIELPVWLKGIPSNFFREIWILRHVLKKILPQWVITFGDVPSILSIVSTLFLKLPVIVSIRNNPKNHLLSFKMRLLRRLLYPLASLLIFQTRKQALLFSCWGLKRWKIIPNPVSLESTDVRDVSLPSPCVIAVGRLDLLKGMDVLIRAFHHIHSQHLEWHLVIVGDGEQRRALEQEVRSLQLENHVHFIGWVLNPSSYLKLSDIFVLPSRSEGFPNALLEAMACGLPVISTRCDFGPEDILESGKNGILVPVDDAPCLAKALHEWMLDSDIRKQMGDAARANSKRFAIETISDQWETLFNQPGY